jgi:hypothetical protein
MAKKQAATNSIQKLEKLAIRMIPLNIRKPQIAAINPIHHNVFNFIEFHSSFPAVLDTISP